MARDILDEALDGSLGSNGVDDIYERAGKKYNLNPQWLKAQDLHEIGPAGGDDTAGDAQHVGHGQLGPVWRKVLGLPDHPTAEQGIMGMAQVMATLLKKHNGNLVEAQKEYTGGPDRSKWGKNTLEYPIKVAGHYQALGGKPGQLGYPPNQGDVLDEALKDVPLDERPAIKPRETPGWNMKNEAANAFTFGQGTKIRSGMDALYSTIDQKLNNPKFKDVPFNKLLESNYSTAKMDTDAARDAYAKENPGKALVADLMGGAIPTAAALMAGQEYAATPIARGLTRSFPQAETGIRTLFGGLGRDANPLLRAGSRVITGGTGGAVAGGLQSGLSDKPIDEQIETGAKTGAVLGPLLGAAGDKISSAVQPRVAALANRLMEAGVDLQPGQLPGVSPVLRYIHRTLGDATGAPQRTQLSRALSRTYGGDHPVIDDQQITQHADRIGQMFERFKSATIDKDPQLHNEILDQLAAARGDFNGGSGIPDDKVAMLDRAANMILNQAGNPKTLGGAQYLALTKRGSELDRLMRDPDVGHHASLIRDALDDALERSVVRANGRWAPAQGGASAGGASGGAMPTSAAQLGSSPGGNRLMNGGSNVVPFGSPVSGTLGGGKGSAPPGMEWVIDPDTQQALSLLRDARGQYKNLQLVSGLVNNSTGEIQPAVLARRVRQFYPPQKQRQASEWENRMQDLAAAGLFVPNASPNARAPGLIEKGVKLGLGGGAAFEGGQALFHGLLNSPVHTGASLGLAALAGGGAKLGVKALDSTGNARRIVRNALLQEDYVPDYANLLLMPPIVQMYNAKDKKKASK